MASFPDNDYNNHNNDAPEPDPGKPGDLTASDETSDGVASPRAPARSVTEGLRRRPPWTLKDKVFHDLFSDPGYLLALYQTLHPEDQTAAVSDLSDATIHHVFINGSHNDLGFMIRGQHLILTEAQSTWSENILVRQLLYLAETWNTYIKQSKADLYSEHRIYLPRAECYVIYTGKRRDRPEWLSLSDCCFGGVSCVDLRVKMIYETAGRDIIK